MARCIRLKVAATATVVALDLALLAFPATAQPVDPVGGGVSRVLLEAMGWSCVNVIGSPGLSHCTKSGNGGYSCGSDDRCYPDEVAVVRSPLPVRNPGMTQQIG